MLIAEGKHIRKKSCGKKEAGKKPLTQKATQRYLLSFLCMNTALSGFSLSSLMGHSFNQCSQTVCFKCPAAAIKGFLGQ